MKKLAAPAITVLVLGGALSANATLIGDEIEFEYFDAGGDSSGISTFLVNDGASPDFSFFVHADDPDDFRVDINVTANSIILDIVNVLHDPSHDLPVFALAPRIALRDLDWVGEPMAFITDVQLVASDFGATSISTTFGPDSIYLDYNGADTFPLNQALRAEFEITTAVPEPVTMAMLGFLSAGMLGARRLRKRS